MTSLNALLAAVANGTLRFTDPNRLFLVAGVAVILLVLLWYSFVESEIANRRKRTLFFLSRFLVLSLIVIAFAGPYSEEVETVQGDPSITLLVDESNSMAIFDEGDAEDLEEELKKRVPVTVERIASGSRSRVGDALLEHMAPNIHFLLFSDGQVTHGTTLSEAAQIALTTDSSISAITLQEESRDASVALLGPSTTTPGVENTFLVRIDTVGIDTVPVEVHIDGRLAMRQTLEKSATFTHTFREKGVHTMTVRTTRNDDIEKNNIFYKTVKVIDPPEILFVSQKDDPLEDFLSVLYDVDTARTVPADLSEYYAIVLNDVPRSAITNMDALRSYIIDGNGMAVIGGFSSFGNGGYKNSALEQLLPVQVGGTGGGGGGANLVIAIDRSLSTREEIKTEKALALSIVDSLALNNNVGAIAMGENNFNDPIAVIAKPQPLASHREALIDRISRLTFDGVAFYDKGLRASNQLLAGWGGSKNIVIISDGRLEAYSRNVNDEQRALQTARTLADQGVRIITVGVGEQRTDEDFLQRLAEAGGGFYLKATEKDRLSVLFGEISQEQGERFPLIVLNSNHFISSGLTLRSTQDRFNAVSAKPGAQLLVTSTGGLPAVTDWRFGLGRVTTFTTFDSSNTLGQVLERDPELISRVVNWDIGNPERKKDYFVQVGDTRIDEQVQVQVKSDATPQAENLSFSKGGSNTYFASFSPHQTGIFSLLNTQYAVNYEKEYQGIGQSSALESTVKTTGGDMFAADAYDEIVSHIRELAVHEEIRRQDFTLLFVIAAFTLYFIEVAARRIIKNIRSHKVSV